MERIKSLSIYQKGLLLFMAGITLVFTVLYPVTIARVGYRYNDAILVPSQENGNTLYSGKIKGQKACFNVSDDTVVFRYGDKTYGPYTVKEDPSAVPEDHVMKGSMTGIEVREGESILFRGGVMDAGDFYRFWSEDGTGDNVHGIFYVTSDGIARDGNGNPVDRMKPSVSTIYDLLHDPELTHKGNGFAWLGAVFFCVLNALSILFADEFFRWHLMFRIRNVWDAEPTDWAIAGRHVAWTAITAVVLALFIMGLQY